MRRFVIKEHNPLLGVYQSLSENISLKVYSVGCLMFGTCNLELFFRELVITVSSALFWKLLGGSGPMKKCQEVNAIQTRFLK